MRSLVIHIVHNSELFIASRALSSQPKFFLINHSLELRIVYGALTLRLRVIHVKHNLKQFIVSRALSSRLITTQKVLFCTFNSLCFKHFCVVVLHLYSNWHVKDLAMTSNHICG